MHDIMYTIHFVSIWYLEFIVHLNHLHLYLSVLQRQGKPYRVHSSDYESTVLSFGMCCGVVDACQYFRGICYPYHQSTSVPSALKWRYQVSLEYL
jgi:hypothetical protein